MKQLASLQKPTVGGNEIRTSIVIYFTKYSNMGRKIELKNLCLSIFNIFTHITGSNVSNALAFLLLFSCIVTKVKHLHLSPLSTSANRIKLTQETVLTHAVLFGVLEGQEHSALSLTD